MHEERKRSVLKAVSWRVIATSTGMFLVFLFTGRWELTAGFGIADVGLKLLFYFLHERLWNMTEYGRSLGGKITSATRSPPVISPRSNTIQSVIQKMVNSNIGAVIISDGIKPIGIITERDILEWELASNNNPNQTAIQEIMSSPVITVEDNTTLTDALKLMQKKHIRRLAVTKDGKLTGITTERRILATLT